MPRLIYIGQTPAEGTGSPVIVLRHLQRLASSGWAISILAETGQKIGPSIKADWTVLTLPRRRAWWPPYRKNLSFARAIRTWLLAGECRRLTRENPPDAVLGYLAAHDDFSAEIATRYARLCGAPLSLLVHDDPAAFTTNRTEKKQVHRRHSWMLRQAHRGWFVSPELAKAYRLSANACRVLPPLPGGWAQFSNWQAIFAERPRVYYAGFIWPAQFPLLRKISRILEEAGVSLVLLTRETPALTRFLLGEGSITHVTPFSTNEEALAHLAREATGMLIAYCDTGAQMPWIATSFPSKLVEQTHLGLPCAIVAPQDSAVARWARRSGYEDFFAPSEWTRLAAWARDLRNEHAWRRRGETVRHLAGDEFSPEKIQAVFSAGLLRDS